MWSLKFRVHRWEERKRQQLIPVIWCHFSSTKPSIVMSAFEIICPISEVHPAWERSTGYTRWDPVHPTLVDSAVLSVWLDLMILRVIYNLNGFMILSLVWTSPAGQSTAGPSQWRQMSTFNKWFFSPILDASFKTGWAAWLPWLQRRPRLMYLGVDLITVEGSVQWDESPA